MRSIFTTAVLLLGMLVNAFCQPDTPKLKSLNPRVFQQGQAMQIQLSPEQLNQLMPRPVKICDCPKNILQDGGCRKVVTKGSTDIDASSPIWKPVYGSPQWVPNGGCCDSGEIVFWGNKIAGEAVSQSVNIIAGRKYRIRLCVKRRDNPTEPYVRIRMFAYSSNYTYNTPSPQQVLVGQTGNITSQQFETITLAECWTAPASFNQIALNPENDYAGNGAVVSWAAVDNICIEEVGCDCGTWGPATITGSGINKQVYCSQTMVIKRGSSYTINPSLQCNCGCRLAYQGVLTHPSGATQNIAAFPLSFMPTQPGYYKLQVTANCGDKKCTPCTLTLFATPGCEGDIVQTVRPDIAYADLASYKFNKNVTGNFLQLDVATGGAVLLSMPDGSYQLRLNKTGTELVNGKTGQVVGSYPYMAYIPPVLTPCEVQEAEQIEIFNRDVVPGLVAQANQTCRNVIYCLTILCDGMPTLTMLKEFLPTDPKCRQSSPNLFDMNSKYVQSLRLQ